MLARPEIGSREHILLWLAGKPADEKFAYHNSQICACGQYSSEHGNLCGIWIESKAVAEMDCAARAVSYHGYGTFGGLYKELSSRWS